MESNSESLPDCSVVGTQCPCHSELVDASRLEGRQVLLSRVGTALANESDGGCHPRGTKEGTTLCPRGYGTYVPEERANAPLLQYSSCIRVVGMGAGPSGPGHDLGGPRGAWTQPIQTPDKTNFRGALRYAPLQIFGPTLRSCANFRRARSAREGKNRP